MIPLESQLCPLGLSKQIEELDGWVDTYFKWVHPWADLYEDDLEVTQLLAGVLEDLDRYTLCKWHEVIDRVAYPAYTLEEILNALPKKCILGQIEKGWYCKTYSDSYFNVQYYKSAIEACAHAYIRVLKETKMKIMSD